MVFNSPVIMHEILVALLLLTGELVYLFEGLISDKHVRKMRMRLSNRVVRKSVSNSKYERSKLQPSLFIKFSFFFNEIIYEYCKQ